MKKQLLSIIGLLIFSFSNFIIFSSWGNRFDKADGLELDKAGFVIASRFTLLNPSQRVLDASPTITTAIASFVSDNSAVLGGDVTSDGGSPVTERGIVYNISGSPTTSDNKVQIGTGTGTFAQSIASLTASTLYYVRSYAINSEGTSYGNEVTFTTAPSPITITSITRKAPSASTVNSTSVTFEVLFAASVSGVNILNFDVTPVGVTGASVTSVSGSGTTWAVVVTTGSGNGTLRLDLVNSSGITPLVSNVPFNSGETYIIDKSAPGTPIFSSISSDTGANTTDQKTSDQSLTFNGSAEPNSTITIKKSGADIGTTTANGSGSWTFAYGATISEGDHTFTTTSTDLAGNTSTESGDFSVTVDVTAPTATLTTSTNPTNSSSIPVTVTFSEDVTGFILSDLSISGGTANTFTGSGTTYSFNIVPNADGTITINLAANKASDGVGNNNVAASQLSIISDRTAPSVSSIMRELPVGALTKASSLKFRITFSENVSGVDAADFEITATGTATGSIGAVAVINSYTYDVTVIGVAGDGNLSLTLKSTVTGIIDGVSNPINGGLTGQYYTIDNTGPAPPTFDSISSNTGLSKIDNVTNDQTLIIYGKAEALSIVTVLLSGSDIGTVTADTDGDWFFDYTGTTLSAGTHHFTAKAEDVLGNIGSESSAFTIIIDTTPPDETVISFSTNTGISDSDQITSDNSIELNGSTEAFSRVIIYKGGMSLPVDSVTADLSGAWTYNYPLTLIDGIHYFMALVKDVAGNLGPPSFNVEILVDKVAPIAPSILNISEDTGVPGDRHTANQTLTFSGIGEINSNIIFSRFSGGGVLDTVRTDGMGEWTYTYATALPEGVHIFNAVGMDDAGNIGASSPDFTVTVDFSAPATPAITGINNDTGTSSTDGITHASNLKFSGTAESNTTVKIWRGATTVGSVTANSGGNWTFDYTTTPLPNGAHTFSSTASDKSGNTSLNSPDYIVTVDLVNPTVEMTSSLSSPTKTSPIAVEVVFSEIVAGFEISDIAVTSGVATELTGSGKNYSFKIIPGGETIEATIPGGKVIDIAGNGNNPSPKFSIDYDNAEPTVTISSPVSGPTSKDSIRVDVTFSEFINGFEASDISITGATIASFTGTGALYSFDAIPTNEGVITINIHKGAAKDPSGNETLASNHFKIRGDKTKPTVILSSTALLPTYQTEIPVMLTFSEEVKGLDVGSLNVEGGSVSNLTGNGKEYSVIVTPFADGEILIDLLGGLVRDSAENVNEKAEQLVLKFKTCNPPIVTASPANKNACKDTPVSFAVVATGTDLTYQWQYEDKGEFVNIPEDLNYIGTTADTLKILSAKSELNKRRFRVIVSGWCDSKVTSDTAQLIIYPDLSAGKIGSDHEIKFGETAETILSIEDPTGADGAFTFQWEQSIDGNTFAEILNADQKTYEPGVVSETTHFRRKVTSGCGSLYSNVITISIESRDLVRGEIPNALFPNGSETNRKWGVAHMGFKESVKISVFNTSGQLLFSTDNPEEEWDGTYEGKLVPEGFYMYVIKDKAGKKIQGSILIVY